jgi:hypothetical protein
MRLALPAVALASALVVGPSAVAERPPQPKSEAAFVFEGIVESVEETKEDGIDYYVVAIRIAKVHKGDLTAGKVFNVSCFQVRKFKPGTTGAAGHNAIPGKGDKIKAYVNKHEQRGGREALYPNWFDKLDKDGAEKK